MTEAQRMYINTDAERMYMISMSMVPGACPFDLSHRDFFVERLSDMKPVGLIGSFKAYVFEDNSALIVNHIGVTRMDDWRDSAELKRAMERITW